MPRKKRAAVPEPIVPGVIRDAVVRVCPDALARLRLPAQEYGDAHIRDGLLLLLLGAREYVRIDLGSAAGAELLVETVKRLRSDPNDYRSFDAAYRDLNVLFGLSTRMETVARVKRALKLSLDIGNGAMPISPLGFMENSVTKADADPRSDWIQEYVLSTHLMHPLHDVSANRRSDADKRARTIPLDINVLRLCRSKFGLFFALKNGCACDIPIARLSDGLGIDASLLPAHPCHVDRDVLAPASVDVALAGYAMSWRWRRKGARYYVLTLEFGRLADDALKGFLTKSEDEDKPPPVPAFPHRIKRDVYQPPVDEFEDA
jgi:hypothetical protein